MNTVFKPALLHADRQRAVLPQISKKVIYFPVVKVIYGKVKTVQKDIFVQKKSLAGYLFSQQGISSFNVITLLIKNQQLLKFFLYLRVYSYCQDNGNN
jgi:hypothetical protein